MVNKLGKWSRLIFSGYKLEDKLTILLYFLACSLRVSNSDKFLFRDIKINSTEKVLFLCRKRNHNDLWMTQGHEKEVLDLIKKRDISNFVDIGAYIGWYSVIIAKKLGQKGKVIAIEPERSNFEYLLKNIKLNKLKNVMPIKAACLDKKGRVNMSLSNLAGSHSISWKTGKRSEKVQGEKLDSIIEKSRVKTNLIKIDVLGAEDLVLKGAEKVLKRDKPTLILELVREEQVVRAKKILSKLGYKLKKIVGVNYLAQ